MDNLQVISKLKILISESLTPLINSNYVYLGLPYYTNIGDTLIWEGTREFLQTVKYKCLYSTDNRYFYPRTLSKDTIILLHGGGNLGDLYREHSLFRKKIIELYPDNKIIILPQTVFYQSSQLLEEDAKFYAQHLNVIICARENYSYSFFRHHFKNNCLLVPDMAFFINMSKYKLSPNCGRVLFLKRRDQELVSEKMPSLIPANAEIRDWPTCEDSLHKYENIELLFRPIKGICSIFGKKYKNKVEDFKRDKFYRSSYVQLGIDFLCPYATIYTTRLHVMILGILLGKRLFLIDNLSGKVINFYNTWLSGLSNIEILKNDVKNR